MLNGTFRYIVGFNASCFYWESVPRYTALIYWGVYHIVCGRGRNLHDDALVASGWQFPFVNILSLTFPFVHQTQQMQFTPIV